MEAAGVGGGAPTDRTYQIVLLNGETVVAYGEWAVNGDVRVGIGGTYDATLRAATNPTAEATGTGIGVPVIDPLNSFFPRIVLRASHAGVKLLYSEEDAYVPNNYDDLDNYLTLVELNQGITQTVTSVRVAAGGANIDEDTVVDGFAVFQNLEPDEVTSAAFLRGDTNNDGKADLSDAVFLLAHLFLGGPRWVCEDAARINPDATQDLSDAVFLLAHLFSGGPAPAAPWPACDIDPAGGSCPESACNS